MHSSTFRMRTPDDVAVFVRRWFPDTSPRAAVRIAHGVAEHSGRYARLAEALTVAGYAVYVGDLRGHGQTAHTPDDLGFFAERDGWGRCVADLWQLSRRIATELPGLPLRLRSAS